LVEPSQNKTEVVTNGQWVKFYQRFLQNQPGLFHPLELLSLRSLAGSCVLVSLCCAPTRAVPALGIRGLAATVSLRGSVPTLHSAYTAISITSILHSVPIGYWAWVREAEERQLKKEAKEQKAEERQLKKEATEQKAGKSTS
jgi:hypothetical protein